MMDLGRHPNPLRAHAVFDINGGPFILLEYGRFAFSALL
jgi:hypothetical protein